MDPKESKADPIEPYVPAETTLPELTVRAVVVGILMAVILGAANAYLGLRAGLTVSATFPAAVVAMAAMRILRGSILEENIARTAGTTGEALVAGAIFTIPAFVLSGVWTELHYWDSTLIMMAGGILGVLFIITLRRPLVVDSNLPFPESVATAELVKAGQHGATGASYVFGAMGLSALIELFKNSNGVQLFRDSASHFFQFAASKISLLDRERFYAGGLYLESPSASPALVGVGFIVGQRVGSVLFCGAVLGWCVLVPLGIFLNPELAAEASGETFWETAADQVWRNQVRPLAVGTMIVAAFHTLWGLRRSLLDGVSRALRDLKLSQTGVRKISRLDTDLDLRKVGAAIALCSLPLGALYFYFTGAMVAAVLLTLVMILLGFLFCSVAGYLVGVIGGSNSPISGLTLSALLISALLMVMLGATGIGGVAAVLAVAGVVCCAAAMSGDLLQDLKVGQILGGTPWRMELVEVITVATLALVLVLPMMALDAVYGIGGKELPAPQAGLMALLAKGVVGGQMPWALVLMGMLLAVALLLIRAPSPMVIAVGMYLPLYSTTAIFVGSLIRVIFEKCATRRGLSAEEKATAENTGVLLASGMVAGESLMAVLLAFVVLGTNLSQSTFRLPTIYTAAWPGLLVFLILATVLVRIPIQSVRSLR